MKNYTFNFEVQTLMEQFVSAFNDIKIKRYDNTKNISTSVGDINVNFVYASKQRVYNVLTSAAPGGLTVPVVAVNISNITRDNNRVFNKLDGFMAPDYTEENVDYLKNIPQPVPVNITVNMSIVTKYQSDMDQILSNFIPYCDPYIIISWKFPFNKSFELRSEVLWNGRVSLSYPDNLTPTQPYRVTADTSFTIKGWLFKANDQIVKKIYTIDEKLEAINFSYTKFDELEYQTKIYPYYEYYNPETPVEFFVDTSEDSDMDGASDETEISMGTDPNDPNSYPFSLLFNVFKNI